MDWASLIVGSNLSFPLVYYIWRGDFTESFLRYRFGDLYLEGLIQGGAYFWNFTV